MHFSEFLAVLYAVLRHFHYFAPLFQKFLQVIFLNIYFLYVVFSQKEY